MGRKKILEKRLARLQKKKDALTQRALASEDAAEVRSINDELAELNEEIEETQEEIDAIEDDQRDGDPTSNPDVGSAQQRSNPPAGAQHVNGGVVCGSYGQHANASQHRSNDDPLDSMEYRQAFANYVRTGAWDYEQRTDAIMTTSDIGKVIPNTIMNELIKELKSYGQLYSRVRKLNVQGGVEFPIEDLVPTVSWITETTVSDTQKAPELKTSVSFGYYIAEARIAQTLLSSVVSLDLLESEIAKLLAEAFVKEFDRIIIAGTGSGQPTGILVDTRVPSANKITMAAADAEDWTKWRTKFFAKIPLSYRGGGVLIMTVDTWESLICTMKDANNRPLYSEAFDVQTGDTTYRFNGKEVILVESDLGLYDYSTATTGQAYMIYLKPENYAINSNLQIGFKRYFHEDSNKWINKGLTIIDGKLLDVNGVYIIKK